MTTYGHSGDLGDVIAALPSIRALGGGKLVIHDGQRHCQRETLRGARFEAIKPLICAQPYIESVEYGVRQGLDYDFSTFRHDHLHGENLADWQGRHVGLSELDLSPWLTVEASPKANGRVVLARSARYHNPLFPWGEIIELLGDRALFVGLPCEHASFGHRVEHRQTANMLELAQIIAGCDLFIGNQSCPFWVAAGLGVPLIQEVFASSVNSILPRANAFYPQSDYDFRVLPETILSFT